MCRNSITVIVFAVMTVTAFASAERPLVLLWLCGHRTWLFALGTMVSLQKGAVMLQLPLLGQDGFPGEAVAPSIIMGSSSSACLIASSNTRAESFPAAALKG